MYIPSPSGRKRFNVLGALNAETCEVVAVTNNSYINSETVCELLSKLARISKKPITAVLDNAKYQRCDMVRACAERLGIELLFLPAYSPNLNLIERFWKFVKKECLNCRYYECFECFNFAISEFIKNANRKHHSEMKSLLSWNFQSFKKVEILTD